MDERDRLVEKLLGHAVVGSSQRRLIWRLPPTRASGLREAMCTCIADSYTEEVRNTLRGVLAAAYEAGFAAGRHE